MHFLINIPKNTDRMAPHPKPKCTMARWNMKPRWLEHLQSLEAPGLKSGDIFVRIGCKTDVGRSNFSVVTPAFADIVSK
jgi:hypothetical protein